MAEDAAPAARRKALGTPSAGVSDETFNEAIEAMREKSAQRAEVEA